MWLVGEKASNAPIMVTTMRLFDKQIDAETYAKSLRWRVQCYYFENPNEKYKKHWLLRGTQANFTP